MAFRPRRREARLVAAAALSLLATLAVARAQGREVATQALGRARSGMPTVEVRLAGRSARLGLDTGATRTTISGRLAEELGLVATSRFEERDASGVAREAKCAGPLELDLGGVALRSECVGWVPGSRRAGRLDSVAGVLGFDALSSADVWIDVAGGQLVTATPGGLRGRFRGVAVTVERRFGRPMISGEAAASSFAGRALRLVVDSGSDAVVLFGDAASELGRHALPGAPELLSAAFSRRFVRRAEIGLFRAGPLAVELGQARLLSQVRDRVEDGVVPLAALGPVLFEAGRSEILLEAMPMDSRHR
jgi:hypothetical protein